MPVALKALRIASGLQALTHALDAISGSICSWRGVRGLHRLNSFMMTFRLALNPLKMPTSRGCILAVQCGGKVTIVMPFSSA